MQLEQLGYGVHLRKNNFEWKGGETQVQDMDAVYRQYAFAPASLALHRSPKFAKL